MLLLGTEITAVDEDVSVHMLAFQYDPSNEHISSMFANTRAARLRRTKRMVERLSQDFPITWDDVLAQVKEGERTTIGRPHIADALVAAGVYETRSDAFADAVSAKSKYYIPTPSSSTHEVIAAVKGAGGVVVAAHAGDPQRNRRLGLAWQRQAERSGREPYRRRHRTRNPASGCGFDRSRRQLTCRMKSGYGISKREPDT